MIAVAAGLVWVGSLLVISTTRWASRPPLTDRLAPYSPGAPTARRPALLSVASVHDVLGPLARAAGDRLGRALGVSEELGVRLRRIHSPLDVTAFRTRQMGFVAGALGAGSAVSVALWPPAPLAALLVIGAPALAVLVIEQQVADASRRWQRRVFLELPIVAEQIGLLVSAGHSVGSAIARVGQRSSGACGADLRQASARIGQGLTETEALREWAALAEVEAVTRLVAILALDHATTDLGRLLSGEARAIRREAQRQLTEQIEARAQQVWIPVTVATLVPGVIFIAVPFLQALSLFTAT